MKISSIVSLSASTLAMSAGVMATSAILAPAQAFTAYVGSVRSCTNAAVSGDSSCSGVHDGNDSLADLNSKISANSALGTAWGTGWSQLARVNEPATTNNGFTLSYAADGRTGTWSIGAILIPQGQVLGAFILGLKASRDYAYYHFAAGSPLSGTWSTVDFLTNGERQPALSHATLYAQFQNAPTNAVPEPFTIVGSVAALGVGSLLRKKQMKKKQIG